MRRAGDDGAQPDALEALFGWVLTRGRLTSHSAVHPPRTHSAFFPLLNAAVSEICPKEQLAGTLGVFLAVMSSGGIVGPYLAGWIVDTAASPASGYALTFQVLGAFAVVGAITALLTVNPPRDARRVMAGA
ncbi:MFS transporter [Streptomyces sp. PSKA54]|uniref:MFS transporter n=2 Tax=Streptomyces TaxID=1883 RepID=A0A7W2D7B4_9ACTN|nr:MFS transporter [Streptomyces himalayensis subsp. aureolus]